jgi:alcohol dehydrogenase YqhD (iron-dependent ADH family)
MTGLKGAVMDSFTFYNPTRIIFGKEAVGQIGGVIKEAGLSRVLGVSEAGISAIVDAALKVGVLGKLKELTGEDIAGILRIPL